MAAGLKNPYLVRAAVSVAAAAVTILLTVWLVHAYGRVELYRTRLHTDLHRGQVELSRMAAGLQKFRHHFHESMRLMNELQTALVREGNRDSAAAVTTPMAAVQQAQRAGDRKLLQLQVANWQTQLLEQLQLTLANFRLSIIRRDLNLQPMPATLSLSLDYAITLAINFGPGFVLGFFGAVVGFFYWVCCRPCKCCGQRQPKPEGYTCAERYFPTLLLLCFGLLGGIFLFFGVSANQTVTLGLRNIINTPQALVDALTTRVGDTTNELGYLSGNMSNVLGVITTRLNNIGNAVPVIQGLANTIGNETLRVTSLANSVEVLANNLSTTTSMLNTLAGYGVSGLPSTSSLPDASTLSSQMNTAKQSASSVQSSISSATATMNAQISSVQALASGTLSTTSAQLLQQLQSAIDTVDSVRPTITSAFNSFQPILTLVSSAFDIREYVTYVPLALPMAFFSLAMVGALLQGCSSCLAQWTNCCLGFWSWFFLFEVWLLFSLHFVLAIVLADACAAYLPTTWVSQFGLPSVVGTLLTCNGTGNAFAAVGFNNFNLSSLLSLGSLVDTGSITGALNPSTITGQLTPVYNILSTNFTQAVGGANIPAMVSQLNSVSSSLNTQTFGGPSTAQGNTALNNIISTTGTSYVFANCSLVDTNTYPSLSSDKATCVSYYAASVVLGQAQTNITSMVNVLNQVQPTLNSAQSTATSINATIQNGIATATSTVNEFIANLTSSLTAVNSLQTNIDGLYNLGSCAVVGNIYSGLVTATCIQIGGGFNVLWFSFMIIGCCMFAGWILGTIGATRYGLGPTGMKAAGLAPAEVPMGPLNMRTPRAAQPLAPVGYGVAPPATPVEPDVIQVQAPSPVPSTPVGHYGSAYGTVPPGHNFYG